MKILSIKGIDINTCTLDTFISVKQTILLEMEMATHSSILAKRTNGQRSLVGYSPRICKESDMT